MRYLSIVMLMLYGCLTEPPATRDPRLDAGATYCMHEVTYRKEPATELCFAFCRYRDFGAAMLMTRVPCESVPEFRE